MLVDSGQHVVTGELGRSLKMLLTKAPQLSSQSAEPLLRRVPQAFHQLRLFIEKRIVDRKPLLLHVMRPPDLRISATNVLELRLLQNLDPVIDLRWFNCFTSSSLALELDPEQLRKFDCL